MTSLRFIPIHRSRNEPEQIAALMGWSLRATALVSGLLGVLLWLSAEVVSAGILGEPALAPLLRVFAFIVPMGALVMVVTSGAQAFDRQDYRALPTSIVQPALQLGLVLLFGWAGYAVTSAVHARAWSMLVTMRPSSMNRWSTSGLREREACQLAFHACTSMPRLWAAATHSAT